MNPELLLNHYIMPIYISTTNVVVLLASVKLNAYYTYVEEFASFAWKIIGIFAHTIAFIMKEALMSLDKNFTFTDLFLIILCLYNFSALLVSEIDSANIQRSLEEKLKRSEKELNYLKTAEKMRDNLEQMWLEEIKDMYHEQNKKLNDFEIVLKNHKEYLDKNCVSEKTTTKLISDISRELKKLKRDLKQYE